MEIVVQPILHALDKKEQATLHHCSGTFAGSGKLNLTNIHTQAAPGPRWFISVHPQVQLFHAAYCDAIQFVKLRGMSEVCRVDYCDRSLQIVSRATGIRPPGQGGQDYPWRVAPPIQESKGAPKATLSSLDRVIRRKRSRVAARELLLAVDRQRMGLIR
jgi:hypothetical protein